MVSYLIISVYDGDIPKFLRSSLDSIGAQIKIVIGIDGQISCEIDYILAEFVAKDNIQIIRFPTNRGLSFVLNDLIDIALKDSECELIFRMDADDICHIDRFDRQIKYMIDNPSIDICGTWAYIIDDDNNVISEIRKPTDDKKLKRRLAYDAPFIHPSVVFRARVLREGWRYPTNTIRFEDVALWSMMVQSRVIFSNINEFLFYFRQTPQTFIRRTGFIKAFDELLIRYNYIVKNQSFCLHIYALVFLIFLTKFLVPVGLLRFFYKMRAHFMRYFF